jgi:hypothetical protein
MKSAVEHADRVSHAWSALAFMFVQQYASRRTEGERFLTEDIVKAASEWGVTDPPDRRAWGAVINRAVRAGFIVRDGYREDRYCSPKSLWRKA